MAQQSSGNDIVKKIRAWLEPRFHSILYGPEVGPARAQQSQAPEPEPTEAAREERGRRDAGVAHDAHVLERRAAGSSAPETGGTALGGAAVVTSTEGGGGEQPDMSGRQHDMATASPPRDANSSGSGAASGTDDTDQAAAADLTENQHDLDSVEPPLDSTRADDTQSASAEREAEADEAPRGESREWQQPGDGDATGSGRSTGTTGMPDDATGADASADAAIQADAEEGSTWAPVHGDTSYDEMTREPVENAGGQVASVVPDVGAVTGTAGATNLDDSAGAPAEQTGLDDVAAQVSDLRDRSPSETDFPDELANADTPEDDGDYKWSGTEETAADLQFGGANEQIGFGTFDSRPEEIEEAGALVAEGDEGDSPEEYGVPSGVTEIVPDSDDEALVGDVERDVNADETGGGTNIAAAAAVIDADAGEDSPRGSVRGDGTATCPSGYPIKGNASSKIYHVPGASSYNATKAEVCFATEEDAVAAGYRAPKGR